MENPIVMKCPKCGNEVRSGTLYCTCCGSPIDWLTVTFVKTSTTMGVASAVVPITYLFIYLFVLPSIYVGIHGTYIGIDPIMCSPLVQRLGAIIGLSLSILGCSIGILTIARSMKSGRKNGDVILGMVLCGVGVIISILFGILVEAVAWMSHWCY